MSKIPMFSSKVPTDFCGQKENKIQSITKSLPLRRETSGGSLNGPLKRETSGGNLNGPLRRETSGGSLNGPLKRDTSGSSVSGFKRPSDERVCCIYL